MGDLSIVGYLVGILICVVFSGYFSASETAFTTINQIRLKTLADNGDSGAALVLKISENYDKMLTTILIGNNIVNIASASMATLMFAALLMDQDLGASVSTAVMTIVVLIFGEVSPKCLAKENPEAFARFSAPILKLLMFVLTPVNFLFMQWRKLLSLVFKKKTESKMTQEELITIVDEAQSEGGIDEENGELIRSAIEFDDVDAREILTPRVALVGVDKETPFAEIAKAFEENPYSRLPVYEESIDNIVGVIHEKDYFCALHQGKTSLEEIQTKPLYISGTVKVSDLLRMLQHYKVHMAVVVDEFGGTEGIVTMEDIVEELVGDIWDEHDVVVNYFQKINDTTFKIDCRADLDEMFEFLDIQASDDDYDCVTVNGWVMEKLEKIPAVGDSFDFEDLHITVTKGTAHHATELTVQRVSPGAVQK